MKRSFIAVVLLVLIAALPIAHADATFASLNYDTQFVSFTLNTAGQGLGVCVAVTATGPLTYATFYIGKTGNLAGATVRYFVDTVASGTPGGNNCLPQAQVATSPPFDVSNLPVDGSCPCTPSTQSAYFTNGTSVILTTGQAVIVGALLVTDPNSGTLNVFGSLQTSAIQSLLCFGSVVGCGAGTANFALCNFVDNCIGYILYGTSGGTVTNSISPYGNNPTTYPCCSPVAAPSLQGSYLRAPDVDPNPFYYLFVLIFIVTLGSYLIFRAIRKTKGPNASQYEIALKR